MALAAGVGLGEGAVPGVGVGDALGAGAELAEVEEEPVPPQEASSKDSTRIAEQL